MNKKIFLVFCCMVCTLSVFAQEGLRKSSEYENYMFIFEKMAENESLTYQNVNFKLENGSFVDKISALNNRTKRERLMGYWNVNMLQFSYDRKKLIFTIEGPGRFESLFLLDGGAGTVTYLFDVPGSAMTSRDLRYLMFSDAPPHDERGEPFVLIDVFEKKMIRTIYWKIAPLDGGGRRIFRSTNPEYDFRIDCEVERTLYATSYYKIATDVLCVTLDLTNSPVESDIEREAVKPEEIGR